MRIIKDIVRTNRGESYIMECVVCKSRFKVKKYDYDNLGRGTFCSNKCRGEHQSSNFFGVKNPNWKGGKIQKKCIICGKRFMVKVKDLKNNRGIYCSVFCKDIDNSRIMKEHYRKNPEHKLKTRHLREKNGRWLGGKSFEPYSSEFNCDLKSQVKNRDDNKCRICSSEKNLNIHHIDYDKKNNKIDNLITLCSVCHGITNTKRKYWKKRLSNLISITNNDIV